MKILYATTLLSTVNSFLLPHIRLLISKGHEVHILANKNEEIKDDMVKESCKLYNVDFTRNPISLNNIKAFHEVKAILRKENYDLIHTHTPTASALTRIANNRTIKTKMMYTAHGFHFYEGAPLKNWLLFYPIEKILGRKTDVLITINEEDYHTAKNRIRPKKTILMNGVGINTDDFKPLSAQEKLKLKEEMNVSQEKFILFYAAELNKNKNQSMLIKMISELKKFIPQAHLYLAGDGPLRSDYAKLCEELKVEQNVTFLGSVDNVSQWLKISDVLVASSQREGLPVNLMEGLAAGLPVVATNIRGHRDIVTDELNGYLVPKDDYYLMASKVIGLHSSKDLRNEISMNNIKKSHDFTIQEVLNNLSEIMKGLMHNHYIE